MATLPSECNKKSSGHRRNIARGTQHQQLAITSIASEWNGHRMADSRPYLQKFQLFTLRTLRYCQICHNTESATPITVHSMENSWNKQDIRFSPNCHWNRKAIAKFIVSKLRRAFLRFHWILIRRLQCCELSKTVLPCQRTKTTPRPSRWCFGRKKLSRQFLLVDVKANFRENIYLGTRSSSWEKIFYCKLR